MRSGVHRRGDGGQRGASVELWLTGESAWFALPGRAETFDLPHSAPLADLLAAVLGGRERHPVHAMRRPARHRGAGDVIDGIRIAGAASFVESALADDVQALVY